MGTVEQQSQDGAIVSHVPSKDSQSLQQTAIGKASANIRTADDVASQPPNSYMTE